MKISELSKNIRAVIFAYYLLLHADASKEINEIEESILDYHEFVGGFVGKWNSDDIEDDEWKRSGVYDRLCPDGYRFRRSREFRTENIMLISPNYRGLPMQILDTTCSKTEGIVTSNLHFKFIRGPNGEIYEVSSPKTNAPRDKVIPTIKRCAYDGHDMHHDVSEIENLLMKGYNQKKAGATSWDSPDSTCGLVMPGYSIMKLDTLPVMLDSQNCTQIRMQILTCLYEQDITRDHATRPHYIRGYKNEVYKVGIPILTKCSEPDILRIEKRVIDNNGKLVQLVCPESTGEQSPILHLFHSF